MFKLLLLIFCWSLFVIGINGDEAKQHETEPKVAYGKFGEGLSFNGKKDMLRLKKIPFNPKKGTIEAWVFLPMLLDTKYNSVIMFIDRHPSTKVPWSYHWLAMASGRRIKYVIYKSGEAKSTYEMSSKSIASEDWVYIAVTYDITQNKMELFVNGVKQASGKYPFDAGSDICYLSIGSRIHNKVGGYDVIFPCQMLIDEIRISTIIRKINDIPKAPFTVDKNTALLLNFDGKNHPENILSKKR
jgi:hypothetical protein